MISGHRRYLNGTHVARFGCCIGDLLLSLKGPFFVQMGYTTLLIHSFLLDMPSCIKRHLVETLHQTQMCQRA